MLAGRGKRLNEQNANSRKLDQGHEGKQGILMEKFYLGSQTIFRFVVLLSWLPMFENDVKVITQKGEN